MNANLTKTVVMGLLCAALAGVGTPGTEAAGPGDHAVLVGRWDEGGRGDARAVAISGEVAYLGVGRNLKILDVSDPTSPALLARLELPFDGAAETIVKITVAGSRAYVGTTARLHVVDVSDPTAPLVVGSERLPLDPFSNSKLVASGDRLYVSGSPPYASVRELRILDVSDPAALTELGLVEDCSAPSVSGSLVYCLGGSGTPGSFGLQIRDLSDPAAPTTVGSLPLDGAQDLVLGGSFVYVLGLSGVMVIDVSNPSAPALVSTLPCGGFARFASVSGSLVLLAEKRPGLRGETRLWIVDVSNPTAPSCVGNYYAFVETSDLATAGSHAYLALRTPSYPATGLHIVDFSDPGAPVLAGSYLTPPGNARTVTVAGSHAWVTERRGDGLFEGALRAVDVSDPSAPAAVGEYPRLSFGSSPGDSHSVVRGDYAYVAAGGLGFRIVDVSLPTDPVEVGALDNTFGGFATSVALAGSHAYVAADRGGLRVIDVLNPAAPVELGSYVPLDSRGNRRYLFAVALSGSHAYLLARAGGLAIVDVSNPEAPIGVGEYGINAQLGGIAISGDGRYAYVSSYNLGVEVLDLSNPAAPVQVGTYDVGYGAYSSDVAVFGSLLYVVTYNNGLRVVDVSDPTAPVEVASYPIPTASGVAADGNHAYVAAGDEGLYVIALDFDDDGVGDPTDACAGSILAPTVSFGNCDSGVENTLFADGCTIADRFAACGEGNGQHVRDMGCVVSALGRLRREAAISTYDQGRIHRCAAQTAPPDLVTTFAPGAPVPEFGWAIRPWEGAGGGGVGPVPLALATDESGSIFTLGLFYGTVDFDPGRGVRELTAGSGGSAFVTRLDPRGRFLWARQVDTQQETAGVYPMSIALDSERNVHVQGLFWGIVDFDPGPEVHALDGGDAGGFLAKLDASGNLVWAAQTAAGFAYNRFFSSGPSIAVDRMGNVYATGITGFGDFDPGPGTVLLPPLDATFVAKFDRDGNLVWVKGLESAEGESIAGDGAGNVYSVGRFYGAADFDPGPGETVLTSQGGAMFVWKLDGAGQLVWARAVDTWTGGLHDLALDPAGNVYTSGDFGGLVDFDPGPGRFHLDSRIDGSRFFAKFDPAGNFVWATADVVYYTETPAEIAVDARGNLYSSGVIDAYPGASDRYLCRKRDTDGHVVWSAAIEGTYPGRIALGPGGSVLTLGTFFETVDFDPGPGTYEMTPDPDAPVFLLALAPPDSDDDGLPDEADACPYSVTTPTVVLGSCDSGVENTLLPNGCTIADRLAPCDDAVNKGHQSGCVASVLGQLKSEGVMSGYPASRIKQCVSQPRSGGSTGTKPASPPGKGGR